MYKYSFKLTLVIALSFVFLSGCDSPEDEVTPEMKKGTLSLGFRVNDQDNGRVNTTLTPTGIFITIKDSNGQILKNLEKLNLVNINGSYVSSIIELDTGDYTVEDFIVVDSSETAIYLTPKTGSDFEELVTTPLPYDFSISPDEKNTVALDVVSASLGQVSDFGYAEFVFNVVDLESGLVANFQFDGGATDESGNGINGAVNGAVLTTDRNANENSAYLFDGDLDYIDCTADNRNVTNEVTVSAWVKSSSLKAQHIVSKINWNEDAGYALNMRDGRVRFSGRDGNGVYNTTEFSSEINDNDWHHILGVCNSNIWEIWVDGMLVNTFDSKNTSVDLTTEIPLTIGYYTVGDEGDHRDFEGTIDDVRVYNRALNPSEIKYLAQ